MTDKVESDPNRTGAEKETGISFLGDEKVATVSSAKKTIVKSLLNHEEFEYSYFSVYDGDSYRTVRSEDEILEEESIVFVSGEIPIGCLTIKSSPRSNNHQSSVVNAEKIDPDAFE